MVRGVEFFLNFFFYISFLAPTASRHKALCPFVQGKRTPPPLTHTHTLHFTFKASFFYFLKKGHSTLPSKTVFALLSAF